MQKKIGGRPPAGSSRGGRSEMAMSGRSAGRPRQGRAAGLQGRWAGRSPGHWSWQAVVINDVHSNPPVEWFRKRHQAGDEKRPPAGLMPRRCGRFSRHPGEWCWRLFRAGILACPHPSPRLPMLAHSGNRRSRQAYSSGGCAGLAAWGSFTDFPFNVARQPSERTRSRNHTGSWRGAWREGSSGRCRSFTVPAAPGPAGPGHRGAGPRGGGHDTAPCPVQRLRLSRLRSSIAGTPASASSSRASGRVAR